MQLYIELHFFQFCLNCEMVLIGKVESYYSKQTFIRLTSRRTKRGLNRKLVLISKHNTYVHRTLLVVAETMQLSD